MQDIDHLERSGGPGVEVCRPRHGVVQIVLLGEHDLASATSLAATIESELDDTSQLVVDLSRTEFIDSSIIETLVQACRRAEQQGVDFTLVIGTNAIVKLVLEVTSLLTTLHAVESLDDALAREPLRGGSENF